MPNKTKTGRGNSNTGPSRHPGSCQSLRIMIRSTGLLFRAILPIRLHPVPFHAPTTTTVTSSTHLLMCSAVCDAMVAHIDSSPRHGTTLKRSSTWPSDAKIDIDVVRPWQTNSSCKPRFRGDSGLREVLQNHAKTTGLRDLTSLLHRHGPKRVLAQRRVSSGGCANAERRTLWMGGGEANSGSSKGETTTHRTTVSCVRHHHPRTRSMSPPLWHPRSQRILLGALGSARGFT